jgi:PhnB protein
MKLSLSPYLNFNGNTIEAMKFYHSILGGELKMQTFGEVNMARTPAEKDMIIHADLRGEDISLMASDTMPDRKAIFGDNVHMSLTGNDDKKLTEVFNRLALGGRIDMPLAKQFWGDTFGMLTDKFGMHWMVNITHQE